MAELEHRPLVLVVDDDEDHLTMIEAALEGVGYRVVTAASCGSARRANAAHPIDVLVADLTLGDGTALDLMRDLGDQRPPVAVVLTGFDTPEDVERTRAAGFDAHLVKPTSIEALAHALATARRRRRSDAPLAKTAPATPTSKRSAG